MALLEHGRIHFKKWDLVGGSQMPGSVVLKGAFGGPSLFSLLPGNREVSRLQGQHRPKAKDSRDKRWTVWDGEQKQIFLSCYKLIFLRHFVVTMGKLTQTLRRRKIQETLMCQMSWEAASSKRECGPSVQYCWDAHSDKGNSWLLNSVCNSFKS